MVGRVGAETHLFANALAAALLCMHADNNGKACGQCYSCHLFQARVHPDLLRLESNQETKSREIRISDVREIMAREGLSSGSGIKVLIIASADQLNPSAANAMLKTLEEPTPSTIILLLTEHIDQLPSTLLSRCQRINFFPPKPVIAQDPLSPKRVGLNPDIVFVQSRISALQINEPLLSEPHRDQKSVFGTLVALIQGQEDPIDLAERWISLVDLPTLIDHQISLGIDILRFQTDPYPTDLLDSNLRNTPGFLSVIFGSKQLHRILRRAIHTKRSIEGNINIQLALEYLLISWAKEKKRGAND